MQTSLVLSNHSCFHLVAILMFSLIGWWHSQPVIAAVYECKAINGSIVLTDKPKRFKGCVLIETFTPSPKVNGAQLSTPIAGDEPPGPAMPFSTPPPLPPHPSFLEEMQGNDAAGQSSASSDHDSASCPPGINPLDPLSSGQCTPMPAEAPATAEEP